ncbi:hypothetical protein HN020_09275 [Brevibacillus borstelensis]|uniref:hypothetical protein n=1 Tax=Brevibacillus borstelensis TaxID=45462 RepID=UPI00148F4E71|nr:hypothetical protein [Brevibacillus borstelensis]NOU54939.1 hypothetical protein [Brevibacillus borstelensis]
MERDAEKDLQMCEAATPGPWKTSQHDQYSLDIVSAPEQEVICWTDSFGQGARDGYFIAEAREALPYWIDRAVSLEKEVGMLRDALEKIDIHIRSTGDPVPHIIQTLKDTLPEYKEWWDIGE